MSSSVTGSTTPSMSKSTKLSFIGVTIRSARPWAVRLMAVSAPGVSISTKSAPWPDSAKASSKRASASSSEALASAAPSELTGCSIGIGADASLASSHLRRLAKKWPMVCWRRSRSSTATLAPACSRATAVWMAMVDLPAPPFSLPTTMTLAWLMTT